MWGGIKLKKHQVYHSRIKLDISVSKYIKLGILETIKAVFENDLIESNEQDDKNTTLSTLYIYSFFNLNLDNIFLVSCIQDVKYCTGQFKRLASDIILRYF